jgi:hypothetical protein
LSPSVNVSGDSISVTDGESDILTPRGRIRLTRGGSDRVTSAECISVTNLDSDTLNPVTLFQ